MYFRKNEISSMRKRNGWADQSDSCSNEIFIWPSLPEPVVVSTVFYISVRFELWTLANLKLSRQIARDSTSFAFRSTRSCYFYLNFYFISYIETFFIIDTRQLVKLQVLRHFCDPASEWLIIISEQWAALHLEPRIPSKFSSEFLFNKKWIKIKKC